MSHIVTIEGITSNPYLTEADKGRLLAILAEAIGVPSTPALPTPTPTVTPTSTPLARISTGGNVVLTQVKGNTTGKCWACGKDGMVNNAYCGKCLRGAAKVAQENAPAPQVAVDLSAFDLPAKASNKGRKGANCPATKCGKFVAKGETFCSTHKGAEVAPTTGTLNDDQQNVVAYLVTQGFTVERAVEVATTTVA